MPTKLPLPSPDGFPSTLPADRRDTMTTLHKAIRKAVPKLAPFLTSRLGPSPIIGYGKYHSKSASGREGDWFTIGLVAGKSGYACTAGSAAKVATSSSKMPRSSAR